MSNLLHKKNKIIKEVRLSTLNLRRDFITMNNKQTDYKRLINLLRQNDIPRIHQLIKTCLNSGSSISALINKVVSAIEGKLT